MLSIIVSWRDRHELSAALPGLCAAARRLQGEVILVNYSGDERLLSQLVGSNSVRIVSVTGEPFFNKAQAQNVGAQHACHDVLFFCDNDIIFEDDTIDKLARRVALDPETFATVAGVRETEPNSRRANNVAQFGYHLRIRLMSGRSLEIVDHEEDAVDGSRHAPGLLFVRREHFKAVLGYNSRLHGWGWEDQDMIARLTLGRGLTRITAGRSLHISHSDEARTRHYPFAASRWESRDRMFRQALNYYDCGDLSGTYETDLHALQGRVASAMTAT